MRFEKKVHLSLETALGKKLAIGRSRLSFLFKRAANARGENPAFFQEFSRDKMQRPASSNQAELAGILDLAFYASC